MRENGVSILEYIIVVVVFMGVAIAAAALIRDLSSGFHNQVTPGLERAYPVGFIAPPTTTPADGDAAPAG